MPAARRDELVDLIMNLERVPDMRRLPKLLRQQ